VSTTVNAQNNKIPAAKLTEPVMTFPLTTKYTNAATQTSKKNQTARENRMDLSFCEKVSLRAWESDSESIRYFS
jgi:hypothetical protein